MCFDVSQHLANFMQLLPYLIEQHSQGNFPVDKIIRVYDGKDYAKAFEDVKQGKTIKAVLKW